MKCGGSHMLLANDVTCVKSMDNRSVVSCPEMVFADDKFMGGVNLMDQKTIAP